MCPACAQGFRGRRRFSCQTWVTYSLWSQEWLGEQRRRCPAGSSLKVSGGDGVWVLFRPFLPCRVFWGRGEWTWAWSLYSGGVISHSSSLVLSIWDPGDEWGRGCFTNTQRVPDPCGWQGNRTTHHSAFLLQLKEDPSLVALSWPVARESGKLLRQRPTFCAPSSSE